jgi:16S rRNA (uracil1498-N3)-methyltransferase
MLRSNPEIFHLRRLYIPQKIVGEISIRDNQHHYIRNVMRMVPGDNIRVFNEDQGEYLATIKTVSKKDTILEIGELLCAPQPQDHQIILLVPPLSKERMHWIIEKATELGVTKIMPIITDRTDIRKVNMGKLESYVIDAAEQSERLSIPSLEPLLSLKEAITALEKQNPDLSIIAAVARIDAQFAIEVLQDSKNKDVAFVIGPAGGFSDEEKTWLCDEKENVTAVSLGRNILRVETAASYLLSLHNAFH